MNEYLERFESCHNKHYKNPLREELTTIYSWAIPNDNAIKNIVKFSPIIEIGAGTGYWASLINKAGGDIVCYDALPGERNHYHCGAIPHFKIKVGSYKKISTHPKKTLFLSWPPYETSFSYDCIKTYKGKYFIYIGELKNRLIKMPCTYRK